MSRTQIKQQALELGVWYDASLQNSWENFGSSYQTCQYMKDSLGIVHLRGMIKSGTTSDGTTIFTLPSGYAPPMKTMTPVVCDNSSGTLYAPTIRVLTDGTVQTRSVTNSWVSLDNITFSTY